MSEWKLYVGLALILGGGALIFLSNSTLFKDGTTVSGGRVVDANTVLPSWITGKSNVPAQPVSAEPQIKIMSCDTLRDIVSNDIRHKAVDAEISEQEHIEMHSAYNRCVMNQYPSNGTNVQPVVQEFTCRGTKLCMVSTLQTIADADTLYTNEYKIRLSLANSPEKGRDGYSEANAFTLKVCPLGSEIKIDQDDYIVGGGGSANTITAKVFCGDKLLNEELLKNYHAVIMKQYCGQSEFSNEKWAKDFGC